jgi:hypothetical protein
MDSDNPFDDPHIDKNLLDCIRSGKHRLTEKRFFEYLCEYEGYQNLSPFREKLEVWRERVEYGECSAATRNRAKKNLQKIDRIRSVIPSRDRGRPPKVGGFAVYMKYQRLIDSIQGFFDGQKKKPSLKLLLSAYPAYKDCFKTGGQVQHRTAKSIAVQITLKREGISVRQLRRIIAEESKVCIFRNRKIANNAEKHKKTDLPL